MKEKRNQIRLSLPAEGWIYLVILLFVSVCAVLRNVNLLIIISGMMFAPLFMSWRIGRHMVRNVVAKRILPLRIHAGQIVNVQWRVANHGRIPCWFIKIADQIQPVTRPGPTVPTSRREARINRIRMVRKPASQASVLYGQIPVGKSSFASYRSLFTSRGQYEAGPAIVSTVFPLGLVRNWFRIDRKELFYVAPRLGTLRPDWDRRLASLEYGDESVRRRRGSLQDEFYALRRWRSGDNMRQIHWRTTAKLRYPMVKQFDQKSNRDLAIVLDLFTEHDSQTSLQNASEDCELILSFAATLLTQVSNSVRGRIAVAIAGQEMQIFSTRSHAHFTPTVMRHLATASSASSPDLTQSISGVQGLVSSGTPCFVISTRQMSMDQIPRLLDTSASRIAADSIRWLACDSTEFQNLFFVDDPQSEQQLQQLKNDLVPKVASQLTSTTNVRDRHVSS